MTYDYPTMLHVYGDDTIVIEWCRSALKVHHEGMGLDDVIDSLSAGGVLFHTAGIFDLDDMATMARAADAKYREIMAAKAGA